MYFVCFLLFYLFSSIHIIIKIITLAIIKNNNNFLSFFLLQFIITTKTKTYILDKKSQCLLDLGVETLECFQKNYNQKMKNKQNKKEKKEKHKRKHSLFLCVGYLRPEVFSSFHSFFFIASVCSFFGRKIQNSIFSVNNIISKETLQIEMCVPMVHSRSRCVCTEILYKIFGLWFVRFLCRNSDV